ncbi:MAG: type II secretion system F family protein [Lachnospiraceae bacterium]|nr:type II secretion system F family protein [Lachnospiraceae bacterium]
MIYLYTAILAAYFILFVLSRKEEEKGFFRKTASYILCKKQNLQRRIRGGKRNWKSDLYRRQLGEKLKILQPSIAVSKQVRDHYLSQYSLILTVVFLGVLLCLGAWISAHSHPLLTDGNYIGRNSYGLGEVPVELSARIEGEEEEIFEYLVEERKYTEEEAEVLYEKATVILADIIRGNNESLEDVRQDLDLVTSLEGYPFEIAWESSSYALINTDGAVNNKELAEGDIVTLTAHFSYEQWSWDYQLYVKVNPVIYTDRELLRQQVEELMHVQAEKTKHGENMVLPENVGEKPIVWQEIIADSSGYFLLLIVLTAGVMYWGRDKDLDQKLERRKKELLLDYPEIVNKLALYMGAGMTIRNAFFKMGEDYKKQSNRRKRYVYEEIIMICYELQSGRSETEAYDHFGKRCQVQSYMKLSALLSQNIRKGSNDLLQMLRQEADNAFAERKGLAKKLGEEAGTKLLLPMMMMLCIVMVIIMIPAYFSFM